jgi:hypothetical protein
LSQLQFFLSHKAHGRTAAQTIKFGHKRAPFTCCDKTAV